MSNIDRFRDMVDRGYDMDGDEVWTDGNKSIVKMWIVDDNGKRVPNTIIYWAYDGIYDEPEDFESLAQAKKSLIGENTVVVNAWGTFNHVPFVRQ